MRLEGATHPCYSILHGDVATLLSLLYYITESRRLEMHVRHFSPKLLSFIPLDQPGARACAADLPHTAHHIPYRMQYALSGPVGL